MSTFTVIDAAKIMHALLAECWDQNKRYQQRKEESQEEYDRRLEQISRECEERNKAADRAREEAIARLEEDRRRAMQASEDLSTRLVEERIASMRGLCQGILSAVAEAGSEFLANAASYHEDADLCAQIIAAREEIRGDARRILDEAALLTPADALEAAGDMEQASRALSERFEQLISLLESRKKTAGKMAGRREAYLSLVRELTSEARGALRSVAVLSPEPDESGAAAAMEAMKTVEYYLYGSGSVYLPAARKQELRRLYGVNRDLETDLGTVGDMDAETLRRLNLQFRSSKKRAFDQEISRRQTRIGDLWEAYASMYEKLRGSLEGALELKPDAEDMLEILERETEKLRPKYLERVRQDMLQEMVERSLRKSRGGLRVRRLAEDTAASGNSRTLYELGDSGTCVEIYTDARGQILIETGAVTEGNGRTDAQKATISRNNQYFCDHELPAILDALREEMEAAGTDFEVRLRKEPEEDRIHTFDLVNYAVTEGEPSVITADGTLARREGAASAPKKRAIDADGGTIDA